MSQNESGTIAIPMYDKDDAVLVLEDGQVYVGEPYGALGETTGEIVFATGMTGYQETLTDPSYDRQIVVQTFPHIGDTGVNSEDPESSRIWVAGYIVRDPSPNVSNWRAEGSLDDDLAKNGIVGLSHIDTRKLVRHLRSAGVMRAGIFSGDALTDQATGALKTIEQLLEDVKNTPQMQGLSLYDEVSTKETYTIEPCGEYEGKEPLYTVAAVDLGIIQRSMEALAASKDVHPGISLASSSFMCPKKLSWGALSQQFPLRDMDRRSALFSTSWMNFRLV